MFVFFRGLTGRLVLAVVGCALFGSILAVLMLGPSAHAQDAKVLATVDGVPVTTADVERARQTFGSSLERVPADRHNELLLNVLIEFRLIAKAAHDAGLDKTEEFKQEMAWARAQTLHQSFVETQIAAAIKDGDVKARYDQIQPQRELRARHILVKTQAEAKAIIAEVADGADFADLAKAKSTGPSRANGGDLGYFGKGRMVPAFDAAAFALKPGEVSKTPVQTQFGWHVIKVEDARERPKPAFDAMKDQLRQSITGDLLRATVQELRGKAKIEIVN